MCKALINFKIVTGKLLMERHPAIFWTPCATHCLDLMLEDIGKIEWIKSCVGKAKNICKFIYNHAFVLTIMRKYTGNSELARPGIMRFALNFITLKSLMNIKRTIEVHDCWGGVCFLFLCSDHCGDRCEEYAL